MRSQNTKANVSRCQILVLSDAFKSVWKDSLLDC